ncbi:DUF6415 family natural product biosynthesis protein [Streptomyces sp. NPDC058280]|uniref:DUF6415 family natural product biosynthesis protein n=1 Tax=Streptomyces sp. NPDC058280 TaxID=3346419 RepID=UPI0036E4825A
MSLTSLIPENDVVPPASDDPNVPKWEPPLSVDALKRVLERITAWTPLNVEAIFDDLDTAIGYEVEAPGRAKRVPTVLRSVWRGTRSAPSPPVVELVERLRGHLARLSAIAVADPAYPPTDVMAQLVERGSPMRDASLLPADRQQAVGLARRLAFVIADLVDVLITARYIKDDT